MRWGIFSIRTYAAFWRSGQHADLLQRAHDMLKQVVLQDRAALFDPACNGAEVYAEALVSRLDDGPV